MIVLALDTTTRDGSVAVVEDQTIRCELTGDGRLTHGERLPADLVRALERADVGLGDVNLLAVAAGPGSFTGLRVGISAMQGLAMATGLKIVPASALDALARSAPAGDGPVAAWIDAQRGQVFAALYDATGMTPIVHPSALPPDDTLAAWSRTPGGGPSVRFIGDGAVRYAAAITARWGDGARVVPPPPLAGVIGRMAAGAPDRAVAPHAVVPIYVRRPDAELARLKRGLEA